VGEVDQVQGSAMNSQGSYSGLLSWNFSYGDQDPALIFTAFPLRPTGSTAHFQSDEYARMVDAARREADSQKRIALYRQIASFVQDQAFVIPTANKNVPWGMRSNVQGLVRQPVSTNPSFEDVWLA
jgi:ABC-type transport system substrate-binding protein